MKHVSEKGKGFTTTAGYLTMAQIIANALGNGGMSGPNARQVGAALTTKFSNVQTAMAAGDYTPVLGKLNGFINQVQAQCCTPSIPGEQPHQE